MKFYVYDCEVFQNDWIVVFRDKDSESHIVYHNDNKAVYELITQTDAIFCGFNSKNYDKYIIQAICNNFTPEEIKQVNDWIIGGNMGWQYPNLHQFKFNNIDIMDDTQVGLSLKAIEGHLGMNIVESSVPFNLDRELTREELEEVISYCKYDVDSTVKLVELRKDYLNNKIKLGEIKGLSHAEALSLTNARLTAMYLGAVVPNKPWLDEREYKYRDNVLWEYIPSSVKEFFDRMADKNVTDEDLWSSKIEIPIGDTFATIGFGGIHLGIPNYEEEATENRVIRNLDVASYYPHLMTICGYTSRNIPDAQIYADMLEERMKAKKSGDKATANALKLVANTTYGAMLDKTNPLYDPLMGRSVCISGQIYLLEMTKHLMAECNSLNVIQLNTDGIMISFDKEDEEKVNEIAAEWQNRTGFELETDDIKAIHQKDVNNYVEVATDDSLKIKGGYLVRGLSPAGAFNINNNAPIISKAIIEYLVNHTPVKETINKSNNIFDFQLIAKASHKFDGMFHDGVEVQRCNRVYASTDKSKGTLYKTKEGKPYKVPDLPEHCVIDNANELSLDKIDRKYYISVAEKRICDFLGIEFLGETKMTSKKNVKETEEAVETVEEVKPNYNEMNIYQKLIKARLMFLNSNVKKSGKNTFMSFKYFELDDIVPVSTKIFHTIGLLPIVNFYEEYAEMNIINIDNPGQQVSFRSPMVTLDPIVSNNGKEANNAIQRLGSVETYQRRYLYLVALDIVESDGFDSQVGAPTSASAAVPPTTETRTEIKKSLTNVEGNANPLQISQLKEACKKLLLKDKEANRPYVEKLSLATSNFANVTKAECESYLIEIGEKLNG